MPVDTRLSVQFYRLITGLADQKIQEGYEFCYGGQTLYADDVAELATPSILCIAQALSERLGINNLTFRFEFGDPNPVFPLRVIQTDSRARFFEAAPFLAEVFEGEVMDCRADLSRLYEIAAQVIQPDYSLANNTNHKIPDEPQAQHQDSSKMPTPQG